MLALAVFPFAIPHANAQLANSPWPMLGGNAKHTGQSSEKGLNAGVLSWTYKTGDSIMDASPAIGPNDVVYIGSSDNIIYSFESCGTLRWTFATNFSILHSPAVDTDGNVYIPVGEYLYVLTSSGSFLWGKGTNGTIYSSPAIDSNGTIYIGSDDNKLCSAPLIMRQI